MLFILACGNAGNEEEYGPRLIVRSIKAIKKGEELLITYTDLLQPKVVRYMLASSFLIPLKFIFPQS